MEQIRVAVTVNEKYLYPLKVMLYSLFTTQKEPVTVYLVHTQISRDAIEKLDIFCSGYGARLKEKRVEKDMFSSAPCSLYFSKEMYYRLMLPWLLPEENRIIYLDPDIIVLDSLRELWEIKLEGCEIAAVRERLAISKEHRQQLGMQENSVYVNSGVLLLDLKKIREKRNVEEITAVIRKKEKEIYRFPDQDVLNILWENQMKIVPDIYNLNPNIRYLTEYLSMLTMKSIRKHGRILHFMGKEKPWNRGYRGGLYQAWGWAEWQVSPGKRLQLAARLLIEPCRFFYGFYLFWKNHKWKSE